MEKICSTGTFCIEEKVRFNDVYLVLTTNDYKYHEYHGKLMRNYDETKSSIRVDIVFFV